MPVALAAQLTARTGTPAGSREGPLVVLLHDLAEDHHSFDPVVPLLAEHARVLAVDLRGHGQSARGQGFALDDLVADLRAVIADQQDPAHPALLIGHGYGAFVACDYASWHPVRGLLTLDQNLAWLGAARLLASLPARLSADDVERVLIGAAGYGPLGPAEQARLRALRRVDPQVLRAAWAPLLAGDRARQAWAEQAIALPPQVPLLCVLADDPGRGHVRWLRDRVRAAKVEGWTPGHYPHLVEPQRFADRVAALL